MIIARIDNCTVLFYLDRHNDGTWAVDESMLS